MCITWLARRLPARDSRWRICSPEEASRRRCRSGRRPVAVTEPVHVTDVGQDPRGHHRPDPGQVHQLAQQLDRELAPGLARHVPGAHASQDRLGRTCGDVPLGLARSQLREHPQRLELTVVGQHPQALGSHRDDSDRVRVVGIGLAVVSGDEQPARADSFAGTSTTCSPSASSRWASRRPAPLLPRPPTPDPGTPRRVVASRRTRPCPWRTARLPTPSPGRRPPRSSPSACGGQPR